MRSTAIVSSTRRLVLLRSCRSFGLLSIAIAVLLIGSFSVNAATIVDDKFADGTRSDPTAVNGYADNNGVTANDVDGDGELESAWFVSNNGGSTAVTPGHLTSTLNPNTTSSYFASTFFTPSGTPVTLNNPGDSVKITWVFTPTGVNAAGNTNQGFNIAMALTPSGSRITADAAPNSALYTGYAIFGNMSPTLGNSSPFNLKEWALGPTTAGALLGTSANWANESPNQNGGTSGNHGFDDNTQYTFTATYTRDLVTPSSLDIAISLTGGTLNGTGTESVSFTDTTPSTFSFDTFAFRPTSSATSAAVIDTNEFKVEANVTSVPEPASIVLLGFGAAGLALAAYRRKNAA